MVLPAPFGPITARSSPRATLSETSCTATRLPKRLLTLLTSSTLTSPPLSATVPNRPRGKNSTTSTNSMPMNDIQLMVIDGDVILQHDEHDGADQRPPEVAHPAHHRHDDEIAGQAVVQRRADRRNC